MTQDEKNKLLSHPDITAEDYYKIRMGEIPSDDALALLKSTPDDVIDTPTPQKDINYNNWLSSQNQNKGLAGIGENNTPWINYRKKSYYICKRYGNECT